MGNSTEMVQRMLGLQTDSALRRASSARGWMVAACWVLLAAVVWWLVYPNGPAGDMRRPALMPSDGDGTGGAALVAVVDAVWAILPYLLCLLGLRAVLRCFVARHRIGLSSAAEEPLPAEGAPGRGDRADAQDRHVGVARRRWQAGRHRSVRFDVVSYRLIGTNAGTHLSGSAPVDWVVSLSNGARAFFSESGGRYVWYRPLGRKQGLCRFEAWATGHEVRHRGAAYRVTQCWRSPLPVPLDQAAGAGSSSGTDATEAWVLLEGPGGQWLRLGYADGADPVIWEGEAVSAESLELR
ncbi:hypothetical protein [Hydrogenophaga sp. 5NK40-0174]|uniref:hypothetical protein n=1 Tax=Hydrogenophaga sp. 5NK40-0174 TaxID=3127649 RepID=UPI0033402D5E